MATQGITEPRQRRSRESFARVRTATLELLAERGVAGVTIAKVSERAGVSVGSIYGRVGSRTNLLRAVQEEELARIVASVTARFEDLRAREANSIEGVVRVFVEEYERNGQTIGALMTAATEIEDLAEAGPRSWRAVRDAVISALRLAVDAPTRAVSESWLEWVFSVADATTIQHLSYPSTQTGTMIAHLAVTVRLLLEADTH